MTRQNVTIRPDDTAASHDSHMRDQRPRRLCRYLADYAAYMLGCGATCIRISKNINRMSQTIGMSADMIILPAHIVVSLTDDSSGATCQYSRGIPKIPVSYCINTRLSRLSWQVAEGRETIDESTESFKQIIATPPFNPWKVMLLVVAANASFCHLFGGGWDAMAIVALATLMGYALKNILLSRGVDIKIVFLLCSFLSAVVGSAGYVFGCCDNPEIALGTSVLYLIPGIPYINSVSDMIDGHYLCAFSRFMSALLLTGCIALGLTGGFLIMNIKIF